MSENFYKRLKAHKGINNNTWSVYGDCIGKNATAMRMAVRNKSLNSLEIRELENIFLKEMEAVKKDPTFDELIEDKILEATRPLQKKIDDLVKIVNRLNNIVLEINNKKDSK